MKKYLYKIFAVASVFSLTACGYRLREVYDGSAYNDPVFVNNFYKVWDKDISEGSKKLKILPEINLDKEQNYVFESYKDVNFGYCEPNKDNYVFEDKVWIDEEFESRPSYGDANKLSNIDDSFRYGVISKLFDGQMFCDGDTQLARTQIDESGFGRLFTKEIDKYDYFGMNLKASFDFTKGVDFRGGKTKVNLHVHFFLKDDGGYKRQTISYVIENVPTHAGENHEGGSYTFFGFKLDGQKINIDRCCGIGVTYDLLDAEGYYRKDGVDKTMTLEETKSEGISHSLMLYEIFLPHSTWN